MTTKQSAIIIFICAIVNVPFMILNVGWVYINWLSFGYCMGLFSAALINMRYG